MAYASGIAGSPPDLNSQVNQLAQMALQSGDHMGFLQQYLSPSNPNRLAAQLAHGIVQQQMQGAQTQQNLNQPQPPTVLDGLEQQQGMAAMPTARGMFDPSVYAQGGIGAGLGEEDQGQTQMARGGVVAFADAGSVADKMAEYLARHPEDAAMGEKAAAERYKPQFPEEGFGQPDTPEAKLAREARIQAAQERVAARAAADAAPTAGEVTRPMPTQPAEPAVAPTKAELKTAKKVTKLDSKIEKAVLKGKDTAKLVEQRQILTEGLNAGRPAPTVAPEGIASPGPTANPTVRAVTPGAAPATPPPAAAAGTAEAAAGTAEAAAGAAKPGMVGRGLNAAGKGLSSLGRIAKFGLGAPLAAGIGWETGQYVGNQLNEYTPIQENIRGFIDQLGMANPNEDRANATMQPGFIENQIRQNKTAKAAGVDPETMAIANNVARQEAGGDFLSPEVLGRVNPQKDSFGAFQLYKNGGLPAFIKSDGARFGLTAPMGTPEFVAQWKKAAEKQPTEFGAAQLKAFETGYLNPTRNALASVLPGKVDPKVVSYFASRQVQGGLTPEDKKAISDIYNDADGDTRKFLEGYAEYDKQNYDRRFLSESKKNNSDKTKYDYNANARRVDQNLTASLGMTASERIRDDIRKGVDTAKEVADVVRQQPLVQSIAGLGSGLVNKARGSTTDKLEQLFPLRTGIEKPPAPKTAQEQYADLQKTLASQQVPERAAAVPDEFMGMDRKTLQNFLLHSGAATLGGTNQYAGVNIGKGLMAGLSAKDTMEAKREAIAAKAEEGAQNRAEKQLEANLRSVGEDIKKAIPNLDQFPGALTPLTNYAALAAMSPQQRRRVGYDDKLFAQLGKERAILMAQIKGAPAAGDKGQDPNPGWGQLQGKG